MLAAALVRIYMLWQRSIFHQGQCHCAIFPQGRRQWDHLCLLPLPPPVVIMTDQTYSKKHHKTAFLQRFLVLQLQPALQIIHSWTANPGQAIHPVHMTLYLRTPRVVLWLPVNHRLYLVQISAHFFQVAAIFRTGCVVFWNETRKTVSDNELQNSGMIKSRSVWSYWGSGW